MIRVNWKVELHVYGSVFEGSDPAGSCMSPRIRITHTLIYRSKITIKVYWSFKLLYCRMAVSTIYFHYPH